MSPVVSQRLPGIGEDQVLIAHGHRAQFNKSIIIVTFKNKRGHTGLSSGRFDKGSPVTSSKPVTLGLL